MGSYRTSVMAAAVCACTMGAAMAEVELLPSGLPADGAYGTAVAVDGGCAVVGAPEDGTNGTMSGRAYVWQFNSGAGAWQELQTLEGSASQNNYRFGAAVAIDGDYIAVGIPGHQQTYNGVGAVYVYKRSSAGGLFEAVDTLKQPVLSAGIAFGEALTLQDSLLVAGAPGSDTTDVSDRGAAYVFHRPSGSEQWVLSDSLKATVPQAGARFGTSISMDYPHAVVGAFNEDDDTGAVYFYRCDGDMWQNEGRFETAERISASRFGYATALSGTRALVGASNHAPNGAVYAYEWSGSAWALDEQFPLPTTLNAFGRAVALQGTNALVGDHSVAYDAKIQSGVMYRYSRATGSWLCTDTLTPADAQTFDRFGSSVALDGAVTLVGAPNRSSGTGTAFLFQSNAAPSAVQLAPSAVIENSPSGALVGVLTATDTDAGQSHTYALVSGDGDNDNAKFTISNDSLWTAAVLDYESTPVCSIRVEATDNGSPPLSVEAVLEVTVTDYNEHPRPISLSSAHVEEGAPVGTVVGILQTGDPDDGDYATFTLLSSEPHDNDSFSLAGDTLKTAVVFSFAVADTYYIHVEAQDHGSPTFTCDTVLAIVIDSANSAPTDITISEDHLEDGSVAGSVVGLLSTTDPDAGDTHTYTLVSGQGSAANDTFTIAGDTLKTVYDLNFGTPRRLAIRVRTTDALGAWYEEAIQIYMDPAVSTTPGGRTTRALQISIGSDQFAVAPGAHQVRVTQWGLNGRLMRNVVLQTAAMAAGTTRIERAPSTVYGLVRVQSLDADGRVLREHTRSSASVQH